MCQKSEQQKINKNPRRVIEINKRFQVVKEFSWILGGVDSVLTEEK